MAEFQPSETLWSREMGLAFFSSRGGANHGVCPPSRRLGRSKPHAIPMAGWRPWNKMFLSGLLRHVCDQRVSQPPAPSVNWRFFLPSAAFQRVRWVLTSCRPPSALRTAKRRRFAPPHVCASRGVTTALRAAPSPRAVSLGNTTALRAASTSARRHDDASRCPRISTLRFVFCCFPMGKSRNRTKS